VLVSIPLPWAKSVRVMGRVIHIVASGVFMPDWYDVGGLQCLVRAMAANAARCRV
jgi:hypothetical protein